MIDSITIAAPLETVFEKLIDPHARSSWMIEVISIEYDNPEQARSEGACFTQYQREGKMKTAYQGVNMKVQTPHHFSYQLNHRAFTMQIDYTLTAQGASTLVEQQYTTICHTFIAKLMGKLFSSLTRKIAVRLLQGLKQASEQ